jgi:hypothetical protein
MRTGPNANPVEVLGVAERVDAPLLVTIQYPLPEVGARAIATSPGESGGVLPWPRQHRTLPEPGSTRPHSWQPANEAYA